MNIFPATDTQKAPIIERVQKILAAKGNPPCRDAKYCVSTTNDVSTINADTSALEKQIDEMVYALYDLTPEEIVVVDGKG